MTGLLTAGIVQTALEVGLIYSLVAMALFLSFTILNVCDLSTDGCYTLGCAAGAVVTMSGHPILAIPAAMAAGICSGYITAFLQTKMGVESILAGIVVNTGLYTINLAVMGFKSNVPIFGQATVFSLIEDLFPGAWWHEWGPLLFLTLLLAVICLLMWWFLGTRLGLSIRATGDSPDMVQASSINPTATVTVGLCVANAMTGLAGCLIGQYNKTCDINLGTGMVTVALASLIIGQTLAGRKGRMLWRIFCVVLGSCLYRFVIALSLRLNVPTEAFKLVSALIVAIAIAIPQMRENLAFRQKKAQARKLKALHNTEVTP